MKCHECQAEIEVKHSREVLSDGAQQHVARCRVCREFQRGRVALQSLMGELTSIEAPADFEFRLRARLANEKSVGPTAGGWGWPKFAPNTAWLSLAGCLALAFAVALYLQQTIPQTAPLPASVERLAVRETALPANVEPVQEIVSTSASKESFAPEFKMALTKTGEIRTRRRAERAVVVRQRVPAHTSVESLDTGSLGALPEFISSPSVAHARQIIPLQLSSNLRPMQIELRDAQGESRTVTIEPLSFGSRDVVSERGIARQILVSSNRGVW